MNSPALRAPSALAALRAFTMVEAVVAIAVIGVGVASTVGVVTKMNQFAAQSRNMTGANTILQNQVDLFQSTSPFPSVLPYGLSADGVTHTIAGQWPIYREDATGNPSVTGTLTIKITQLNAALAPNTYQEVVTLSYNYLNRAYSVSMTSIRASDT